MTEAILTATPLHRTPFRPQLVLDSTRTVEAEYPPAVPGTQRSLMVWQTTPQEILAVAKANASLNFHSICLDEESPDFFPDKFPPQQLHDLIAPVVAAGHRVTVYAPPQLFRFNDNYLKVDNWTPAIPPGAQQYADENRSWIDLAWGICINGYFGAPANDQSTLIWIRNMAKLSRLLFPHKPVIVTVMPTRDPSWYAPEGLVPDSVHAQLAAEIHNGGMIGQVWGDRTLALPLFKALGVIV